MLGSMFVATVSATAAAATTATATAAAVPVLTPPTRVLTPTNYTKKKNNQKILCKAHNEAT